jgi:SAM-dependent methyltransferase
MKTPQPLLYTDLADWWPVLSMPADYEEEAAFYCKLIEEHSKIPVHEVLELGSGGGNNASHMKAHYNLTLVDLSKYMLAVSRGLNPECEHIQGDMREIRLGRTFDAVFVHDAVSYITSEEDLVRVMDTTAAHVRPGGVVLLCPDEIKETFQESTSTGGHDLGRRSLRYLEWHWDPDPTDDQCVTDFAYMLREVGGEVRCLHDTHHCGLFSKATWLRLLEQGGFRASVVPFEHSEIEPGTMFEFVGVKE